LADTICILDDVQFSDGDFINRNKIKTAQGPKWLTVPINKKNHMNRKINQIEINNNEWKLKHISLLRQAYSKTPYFETYIDKIENLFLESDYKYIIELDLKILQFLFADLEIKTNVVLSSSLNIEKKKSDLILSICKKLGANMYISGMNGLDYLHVDKFIDEDIKIAIQNYKPFPYNQVHGAFTPNLSVIDLLFNAGPETRDIIMTGNAKVWNELLLA